MGVGMLIEEFQRVFHRLTAHLQRLDMEIFISLLEAKDIPAMHQLAAPGGRADALYLVGAGKLEVSLAEGGNTLVLQELNAGDWGGEEYLFCPDSALTIIKALQDSRVLVLSANAFAKLRHEYPRLAALLTQAISLGMAQHLRSFTGVSFRDVEAGRYAVSPNESTGLQSIA